MEQKAPENNEYALLNFSCEADSLLFQPVVFYKMNEDGSFVNGTTVEEMLRVSIERLTDLNGNSPCKENSVAIIKTQEALMWLEARTKDRVKRGVEGKHEL